MWIILCLINFSTANNECLNLLNCFGLKKVQNTQLESLQSHVEFLSLKHHDFFEKAKKLNPKYNLKKLDGFEEKRFAYYVLANYGYFPHDCFKYLNRMTKMTKMASKYYYLHSFLIYFGYSRQLNRIDLKKTWITIFDQKETQRRFLERFPMKNAKKLNGNSFLNLIQQSKHEDLWVFKKLKENNFVCNSFNNFIQMLQEVLQKRVSDLSFHKALLFCIQNEEVTLEEFHQIFFQIDESGFKKEYKLLLSKYPKAANYLELYGNLNSKIICRKISKFYRGSVLTFEDAFFIIDYC